MKRLLLPLLLLTVLMGCTKRYRLDYKVVAWYSNGDIDTITGWHEFSAKMLRKDNVYDPIELGQAGCIYFKYGDGSRENIACGVRTFKTLNESEKLVHR